MGKTLPEVSFAVLSILATACGGSRAAPADVASGAPVATGSATSPPAGDDDDDMPPSAASSGTSVAVTASGSITKLETLLTKTSSGFPSGTESDAGCVSAIGLVGDPAKDFLEVAKHCGTNTGMKEFTHKLTGKLDAAKHASDTYDFFMLGGFCYRFFTVGDANLSHFTVAIERPNGAVLSIAETKEGVAFLDPKAPWCKTHDREFHIVIEAKGQSAGGYTFGIWARPK